MSIESIAPIGAAMPIADVGVSATLAPGGAGSPAFLDMISQGLQRVDASLREADTGLRALAAGEDVPVHEVMMSMERARLDLMLAVEVRNRLVEVYQELNRMQM